MHVLPEHILVIEPQAERAEDALTGLCGREDDPQQRHEAVDDHHSHNDVQQPVEHTLLAGQLRSRLTLLHALVMLACLERQFGVSALQRLGTWFCDCFTHHLFSHLLPMILTTATKAMTMMPMTRETAAA